jgi:DNA-binding NtrC family response regulator
VTVLMSPRSASQSLEFFNYKHGVALDGVQRLPCAPLGDVAHMEEWLSFWRSGAAVAGCKCFARSLPTSRTKSAIPVKSLAHGRFTIPSTAFQRMMRQVVRLARDRHAPIVLEGESGSGKTQLARQIHALSPRSAGPFVPVRLNALVDGLSGSELFGHVAGAYTGARERRAGLFVSASGGTVFLDELGKASLPVQMMLLDAIEAK